MNKLETELNDLKYNKNYIINKIDSLDAEKTFLQKEYEETICRINEIELKADTSEWIPKIGEYFFCIASDGLPRFVKRETDVLYDRIIKSGLFWKSIKEADEACEYFKTISVILKNEDANIQFKEIFENQILSIPIN